MRLVLFGDDFRLGVLRGDRVVDASAVANEIPHLAPQQLVSGLIAAFDSHRSALEKLAVGTDGVPLASLRLRPPVPRPGRLVCMAVNYMESGHLKDRPPLNAFNKSSNSVIGHGDVVVLPSAPASVYEHEAELALVVGKTASAIKGERAYDHIFGYVNFIDVSARGAGPAGRDSFFIGKSWDTFGPMGPVLVTADEVPNPMSLPVKLWVQGDLRQDYTTADMAHDIPETLEWVSWVTTLEPGDVVSTGTNHRGLGALQDGDRVEMEVADFGRLAVSVRDDLKRTWSRETRAQREDRLAREREDTSPSDPPGHGA
jgi:2-keto-4-pentenoate hydratase/2-oxohepta-3-ene-1,7-dioic acid hydratase in catechol pathway